jgi:hypothetical protein
MGLMINGNSNTVEERSVSFQRWNKNLTNETEKEGCKKIIYALFSSGTSCSLKYI